MCIIFLFFIRPFLKKWIILKYHSPVRFFLKAGKSQSTVFSVWPTSQLAGDRIFDLGIRRGSLASFLHVILSSVSLGAEFCASMVVVSGCVVCGCGFQLGIAGVLCGKVCARPPGWVQGLRMISWGRMGRGTGDFVVRVVGMLGGC